MIYTIVVISQWYELRETAISLRRSGQSIKTIHRNLGIPLSTLSGWLRHVELAEEHKLRLKTDQQSALKTARQKAADWHNTQTALHLLKARQEAQGALTRIELTDAVLDLALAMLYFSQDKRANNTSIASSDPGVLRFVLTVLKRNYGISPETVRCDLHLRMDQDSTVLKAYWSQQLNIPLAQFKYVAVDKRSAGTLTYEHYKGVCVLRCNRVAIQRKLRYLYKLFCEKIAALDTGT